MIHVVIKNNDRPFDGLVLYFLSKDYFHVYVFLLLSSSSIWYAASYLILTHYVIPVIVFELILHIYLILIYLFFYISYYLYYDFWIGIAYLSWFYIFTSILSRYCYHCFFLVTSCYKFGIFIWTSQYLFFHIISMIILI